ncbi:methyltransferase domain protein, partial [Vibrio parahaemolyticus V-223/04]|jgi:hypothetical protein
VAF